MSTTAVSIAKQPRRIATPLRNRHGYLCLRPMDETIMPGPVNMPSQQLERMYAVATSHSLRDPPVAMIQESNH